MNCVFFMQITAIDNNNKVQYSTVYSTLPSPKNRANLPCMLCFLCKIYQSLNDIRSKMLFLHLAQRFQKWQTKKNTSLPQWQEVKKVNFRPSNKGVSQNPKFRCLDISGIRE